MDAARASDSNGVTDTLGTLLTIFRASTRLNAEQCADLNFTWIEVQTMYLMSTKQQIIKWQFEKVEYLRLQPVMTDFSFGIAHAFQAPASLSCRTPIGARPNREV
jgi:hypothetical protein